MNLVKPAVGVAALALATGVALPSIGDSGNKYASTASVRNCDSSGDTVTLNGPLTLWPPNHKFVNEPVTAQPSDNSSGTSITLTPTATDVSGGDGGPQNDPDTNADPNSGTLVATDSTDPNSTNGSATAALQVRSERSGKGDGRTYIINWTASFNNGTRSCTSDGSDADHQPFAITVPHDQRGGAGWKTAVVVKP